MLLCAVSTPVLAFPSSQIPLFGASEHKGSGLCPQATPLYPSGDSKGFDAALSKLYKDEAFQLDAFEALGRAVRVP